MDSERRIDYNGLGEAFVNAKPTISSPIRGVGKRCFFAANVENKSKGVELYVETVVSNEPTNPELGFTDQDLTIFRGVAIYDIIPSDEPKEKTQTYGEVIPFDIFTRDYITDDYARNQIILQMERLEKEAMVKDSFFDKLNGVWQDREINLKELYSKRLH